MAQIFSYFQRPIGRERKAILAEGPFTVCPHPCAITRDLAQIEVNKHGKPYQILMDLSIDKYLHKKHGNEYEYGWGNNTKNP